MRNVKQRASSFNISPLWQAVRERGSRHDLWTKKTVRKAWRRGGIFQ